MAKELARAHIFIQGQVQGVAYRWWTQKTAERIGLTGWVKNLEDGRVEIVAEGEKGNLEKLIELAKTGPRFAEVTHVDVIWEDHTGEYSTFEVVR